MLAGLVASESPRDGPALPLRVSEGMPTHSIVSVNESISFTQLFDNFRAGSISTFEQYAQSLQQCHLTQCSVVKSREGPFSIVDKCLLIDEVCTHFGSFVKFVCDT